MPGIYYCFHLSEKLTSFFEKLTFFFYPKIMTVFVSPKTKGVRFSDVTKVWNDMQFTKENTSFTKIQCLRPRPFGTIRWVVQTQYKEELLKNLFELLGP